MTFEEIAVELGLEEVDDAFTRGWSASERSFPGAELPFLGRAFIAEYGSLASLDAGTIEELTGVARSVRRNPALAHLLWHEHRLFCDLGPAPPARRDRPLRRWRFRHSASPGAKRTRPSVPFLDEEHDPAGFPELVDTAIEGAPALNLLIALSAVPGAQSLYEQRRIPSPILRDTLSDFAVWLRYYRERLGYAGINVGTLSWLRFHLRGRLFRLGRLQFMQGAFTRDLTVYRSTSTAELRALAADGLTVDGEGLLLFGPEEAGAGEEAWTTRRSVDEEAVYGNPVDPNGRIAREELRLPFEEWTPVLQERTPVLEMHIPEGGAMSPEACASSVLRAVEFFRDHFPERAFAGFTCESWFLGRELLDLLSAGSNMRAFADGLSLYPCLGSDADVVARLFGPSALQSSPSAWPRETSLQRAAMERLVGGGRLRPGGGFLLEEDLPWGRHRYRASS